MQIKDYKDVRVIRKSTYSIGVDTWLGFHAQWKHASLLLSLFSITAFYVHTFKQLTSVL